ncbi:hypothetical protein F511_30229 [Dorcoceras hygrometricum]|uniref:Uncharacterized protein n=1 Tax=Dorcoceras hygrometricum TaxID=472368 RepID=A0A2Z7ATE4_9LAMI|nr:hypothetical protein F511_30229 [Dorcoceras hygrometricum]
MGAHRSASDQQVRATSGARGSSNSRRTCAKRRGALAPSIGLPSAQRLPIVAQRHATSGGKHRPALDQRSSSGRPSSHEAAPSVARDARPAAQLFAPRASSDAATSVHRPRQDARPAR